MSIWERAHRQSLERAGPFRKNLKSDWTNFLSVTLWTGQSYFFMTSEASRKQCRYTVCQRGAICALIFWPVENSLDEGVSRWFCKKSIWLAKLSWACPSLVSFVASKSNSRCKFILKNYIYFNLKPWRIYKPLSNKTMCGDLDLELARMKWAHLCSNRFLNVLVCDSVYWTGESR